MIQVFGLVPWLALVSGAPRGPVRAAGLWLALGAALVAAGCSSSTTGAAEPAQAVITAFEGARLIVGDGSPAIENGVLVVRDGKLTDVGPRDRVSIPDGAARVSITGKTVMPVMVDLHAHVGFSKDGVFAPEHYSYDNIVDQLKRLEYYGVGAMLSLGTDVGPDVFRVREDQRGGTVGGAKLDAAGRGFVAPGGGPRVQPLEHVPYEVDRPALARLFVRELAAQRVDMIKVWVDDRLGLVPKLAPDVYRAIIDEAHTHNIRVMAHVYYLADAKELLRAGVDGFAHMVRDVEVDDEFVQLAKQRNAFVCAAIGVHSTPIGSWVDDPALAETVAPRVLATLRANAATQAASANQAASAGRAGQVLPQMHRSLQKLNAAGVRIAFGTDTVVPGRFYGFNEHLELASMVAAGLSPLQVITAATGTSAEILGVGELGGLRPGKSADFIVLDANPLENISNTRKISAVYRKGRALDRAALSRTWVKRES